MYLKKINESRQPLQENLLANMLGGAVVNLGLQAISGNLKNAKNVWQYLAVGGLAGATNGFVCRKLKKDNGLISGTLTGLVLGAGNALIDGDSISADLLKYSALVTAGKVFWNGISNVQAQNDRRLKPFEETLPMTDVFLKKAREVWFKDFPMEYIKKFSVENVPEKSKAKMEKVGASAVTNAYGYSDIDSKTGNKVTYFSGKSEVFFSEKAFESPLHLYYTMGHELLHAYQNVILSGEPFPNNQSDNLILTDLKEFYAHSFQAKYLGDANIRLDSFSECLKTCIEKYPDYYKEFNYFEFPWIKSINFVYPF